MRTVRTLSLFGLCLGTSVSLAQTEADTIQGSLGGVSNQVNRDIGDVPGNRYIGDFKFKYHKNHPDEFEKKFQMAAQINDQNLTQYSIQEAFATKEGVFRAYDRSDRTGDTLRFGRQVLAWSMTDAIWGFGKLNNRVNFNGFEPGQEGLVGVTYSNHSTNGFFWRVFGTPVYVPETNPPLDIDKDKKTITSRSPWAEPPARRNPIEPNGPEKDIRYSVKVPSIASIINRPAIGVSGGWENEHWIVDGFFIRKPENQVSVKAEVNFSTTQDVINANVTPEFYYHDVFGGNVKWRNADVEIYASGFAVFPNTFPDQKENVTQWTEFKTQKKREAYGGWGISKSNDNYAMGFNYIARLSPFDRNRDTLVTDPRWNQALNVHLMRNFGRLFNLSGDLKYDMLTTDRLVMLRAGYNITQGFLVTFGVNMIGTPSNGKSYWSPYTNNDAVYGGLRYVF